MELLTLTLKEVHRLEVIQSLAAGQFNQAQAARALALSVRQLRRLLRRYASGGVQALRSQRRGRRPNNALDPALADKIIALCTSAYTGFGPTLVAEKLRERDDICISRETVRKLLGEHGLWAGRTHRTRPRPPRERRYCFGELVQADGSPHNWFEDRGPRCTLLVAIDDATSRIGAAHFAPAETTDAYFELFEQYFNRHGLPGAFYVDRHSIFRVNTPLSEDSQTQVGRAMHELNIELICANSPQAKGRVERANRTLQDRLIKEMRLAHISTLEQGNAFLPEFLHAFNAKFAKAPADALDVHRSIEPFALEQILCQQFERTLSKNLTFQYENAIYALRDLYSRQRLRAGVRVQMRAERSGRLTITHGQRSLEFELVQKIERNPTIVGSKELQERPAKRPMMPQKARLPKPDHPWRRAILAPAKADISALRAADITALR